MKKLFLLTSLVFLTAFTAGLFPVSVRAQDNLFETLEDIKEDVEKGQERVGEGGKKETVNLDLIDFSEGKPWGNLPSRIVEILKSKFSGIKEIMKKSNYDKTKSEADFKDYLKKLDYTDNKGATVKLTDNDINLIFSAMRYAGNWGSLPNELILLLGSEKNGIKDLNALEQMAGYSRSKGNIADLRKYLTDLKLMDAKANDIKLSEEQVNLIINEILYKGESQIYSIVQTVARVMRNLIAGLAVLWIIISGVRMVLAEGDESKITEQKRSITYVLIGLGAILLIERGIALIYGAPGADRGLSTEGPGLSEEIYGIISFAKALLATFVVVMVIIAGIKTIASEGDEEKIKNQRKSIVWLIVGVVIILVNRFVIENLYIQPVAAQLKGAEKGAITADNVKNIINLLMTVIQFALGFVGLIAFAILIYAGGQMITNFGDNEAVEKSKKTIKNALMGIVLIIAAFAIVSTVIKFK